ncbi:DUF6345 domain-containing protein [Paraconexibacter sp.]|uniref:DUF6345 domain-containing protein n=1 Tax=Paraconexibacter sp. TaxID=2949640 RepID=UPI00356A32FB
MLHPAAVRRATIAAALLSLAAATPSPAATAKRLPVYKVNAQGISSAQAKAVAKAFDLRTPVRRVQGVPTYLDSARFLRVPSVVVTPDAGLDEDGNPTNEQAFDLPALAKLKVLSPADALSRVTKALDDAGLGELGSASTSQSRIGLFGPAGAIASKVLGTQVSFKRKISGLPVVGPGENASVMLAGDGSVSRLNLASRRVTKTDTTRKVIPAEKADATAAQAFTGGCPNQQLKLSRRLVYYSPPATVKARAVVPHYEYRASTVNGGQVVNLLGRYVPAVQGVAPVPKITVTLNGSTVTGRTGVKGGKAPYTYSYTTCSGGLAGPGGPSFSYQLQSREPLSRESVTVAVTDANGVTGYDTATLEIPPGATAPPSARRRATASVTGVKDFGVSYIGAEQDVPGAEQHALDFSALADDVAVKRYSWGHANFWDTDYIDPSLGGDDSSYADNVDLAFVTAHGWPGGFVSGRADGAGGLRDVQFSEAKWGNGDMEWMALLSCQTLKFNDGGKTLFDRWYKSWAGLHLQLGFSTNAYNTDGFGKAFGFNVIKLKLPIVSAWALASHTNQPAGVVYGFAGPLKPVPGSNNTQFISNYNDKAWSGPSSADIQPTGYYWALYGQV